MTRAGLLERLLLAGDPSLFWSEEHGLVLGWQITVTSFVPEGMVCDCDMNVDVNIKMCSGPEEGT